MRTARSRWFVLAPIGLISATSWWGCLSSNDTPAPAGIDAGALDGSLCGATGCPDTATSTPDAPAPVADSAPPPDGATALDASAPDAAVDASTPNDVFLDGTSGLDTNAGTAAAPFKTFTKAFAVVPAGSSVWLADGAYNPTNQATTSVAIPSGVGVRALHVGLASLDGLVVNANGASATIDGLVLDKGTSLGANDAAASSAVSLSNLQFKSDATTSATLAIGGQTKVTMTSPAFSGPLRYATVTVGGGGELVIVGGTFDAGGSGAPGFGASLITLSGTSKLTLDGVTMKNATTPGIGAAGTSAATPVSITLKNGTVLDTVGNVGNCAAAAAVILTANVTLLVDDAQIKNAPGAGICVRNGTGSHVSVTLQNGASLINDVSGFVAETGTGSEATVVMNGASVKGNTSYGINWAGTGSFDLQNTTFTGGGTGLFFSVGAALSVKARGCTITDNTQYGLQASEGTDVLTLDLGTVASPGGNTLSANTTSGLQLNAPAGTSATAVGNTWNASIQSADAAGHYTAGTPVTGPATGTNYALVNASALTL